MTSAKVHDGGKSCPSSTKLSSPSSPAKNEGIISLRGVMQWSLRAHWTLWYPWLLVCVQGSMIIVLLVMLMGQRYTTDPVGENCDVKPKPPTDRMLLNLVKDVKIDKRILQGLSVPAKAKSHPRRIFFNRVPKCGTHTLLDVLLEMSWINNFTFARSEVYMTFHIDDIWQEDLARRFMATPVPLIFERHLHFMEFEKYGAEQPLYFNIIREPLERMASWYYFRRYQYGHERDMPLNQRIRTFDQCVLGNYSECVDALGNEAEEGYFKMIPFFCGQDDICRTDSDLALARAVENVQNHYAVVGVSEHYPEFIEALEHVLPDYFRGVTKVYQAHDAYFGKKHVTTYKLPISNEVALAMYPRLKREYQFYGFIKNRFNKLYKSIKSAQERVKEGEMNSSKS